MKYNINQEVVVKKDLSVKKIIDREIIDGIELYYMDDITCYPEFQIFVDNEIIMNNLIKKNIKSFDNLIDMKSLVESVRRYRDYVNNLK